MLKTRRIFLYYNRQYGFVNLELLKLKNDIASGQSGQKSKMAVRLS